MPQLLVASSPVEIEAKSADLPPGAQAAAQALFHTLTDRVAQVTVALSALHEDWPAHRFYFGADGPAVAALLHGLAARPDILDATNGVPEVPGKVAGLYLRADRDGFIGVLVAHEDHGAYHTG